MALGTGRTLSVSGVFIIHAEDFINSAANKSKGYGNSPRVHLLIYITNQSCDTSENMNFQLMPTPKAR